MNFKIGIFTILFSAIMANASNKFSNFINHEKIENQKFGNLMAYIPMGPYKNLVLFASGEYGWASPASDMARALAEEGFLVVGFSTSSYVQTALAKKTCIDANKDFSELIQLLQTRFQLDTKQRPLLYGYSTGSTFVFATILQQANSQFQASVGTAFCPDLKEADQFCKVGALGVVDSSKGFIGKKMFTALKAPKTSFLALNGDKDKFCKQAVTTDFMKSLNQQNIQLQIIPDVGHSFQSENKWKTSFLKLLDQVSRK